MSDTVTFRKDMRVMVDPEQAYRAQPEVVGRVFTVAKVNPKNVVCNATDGGRGINYPKDLLVPAPAEGEPMPTPQLGRPFEPREFFAEGDIVTFTRPYKHITTDTPCVVLRDNEKRVNVAPLGTNDAGWYVRAPHSGLVKRDLAWLAERLMEMI